jgi:hypothetical protein
MPFGASVAGLPVVMSKSTPNETRPARQPVDRIILGRALSARYDVQLPIDDLDLSRRRHLAEHQACQKRVITEIARSQRRTLDDRSNLWHLGKTRQYQPWWGWVAAEALTG